MSKDITKLLAEYIKDRKICHEDAYRDNYLTKADCDHDIGNLAIENAELILAKLRIADAVMSGGKVEHIKRGTTYIQLGRGKLQTDTPILDNTELVGYIDESGNHWFRPVWEFDDDNRFRRIT
jgi:hypothetical protein